MVQTSGEEIYFENRTACRIQLSTLLIPDLLKNLNQKLCAEGLRQEDWQYIEPAIAESLNNGVLHSYYTGVDSYIEISWAWTNENFLIRIYNPGQFQPFEIQPRLPENNLQEYGRGLFIIHSLMDHISHRQFSHGHEITMQKKIKRRTPKKEEIKELEESLQGMTEDLSSAYESISTAFYLTEKLALGNSFKTFAEQCLQKLAELLHFSAAVIRIKSSSNELEIFAKQGNYSFDQPIPSNGIFFESQAFSLKKPFFWENFFCFTLNDPLRTSGFSGIAQPVIFHDQTIGVLSISREVRDKVLKAGEIQIIRIVAELLGIARMNELHVQEKEQQQKSERELEIASSIQQSLIPKVFPKNDYYNVYGLCKSANLVGGDFFDIIYSQKGPLLIVIADVMGKGVPASIVAATIRTAIRAREDLMDQPSKLLTEIGKQVYNDLDRVNMFVTAQIVYIDPILHKAKFSGAGHCPLLKISSFGKLVEECMSEGVPLGISFHEQYPQTEIPMNPSEGLIMITDGLYEIYNAQKEMFGFNRLKEWTSENWKGNSQNFCESLLSMVHDYSNGNQVLDDQTIVAIGMHS
jgi:serine phosphatase RsbU (regulator of sigma subunit)/anti-sigma regulatory factor (Ser/Thr protein kinase)